MISISSLAEAFGTFETITITAVSGADLFGYARCRLSNGRSAWAKMPMVGDVYAVVRHPARITRFEHEDAFLVERWGEPAVKMSRAELYQKVGLEDAP